MSYYKYFNAAEHTGICVVRRKDETDEELIKRFRKKYSKSGISKEVRARMYYEKPSEQKRRKKLQAIRSIQREEEKARLLQEKIERKKISGKPKRKERYNDKSSRG